MTSRRHWATHQKRGNMRFGGIGIVALLALLAAVIKIIMMNAGR